MSCFHVGHISFMLDSCWLHHFGIHGSARVSCCLTVLLFLWRLRVLCTRCVAVDIILMDSNVTITCLECGRENTTRCFCYGQSKDVWCRRCHSKLTVYAEQCKFVQHQPKELNRVTSEVPKQSKLKQKEPVLKLGSPLPECGTCEHYKKSHRWLRYVIRYLYGQYIHCSTD